MPRVKKGTVRFVKNKIQLHLNQIKRAKQDMKNNKLKITQCRRNKRCPQSTIHYLTDDTNDCIQTIGWVKHELKKHRHTLRQLKKKRRK